MKKRIENSKGAHFTGLLMLLLLLCAIPNAQAQGTKKPRSAKSSLGPYRVNPVLPIPPSLYLKPPVRIPPLETTRRAPLTEGEYAIDDYFGYDYNGDKLQSWHIDDLYVEIRGDIVLSKDKKSIKSLSRNGYMSIKKGSSRQEIYIEEEDGVLYYDFYRRGRKLDFEGEGEAWFRETWKRIVAYIKE